MQRSLFSSLVASDSILSRDLWPNGVGRLPSDAVEMKDLPVHRIVPVGLEGVRNWLCVEAGHHAVTRVWVNPTLCTDGTPRKVIVRFVGVVEQVNLGALGNWNGYAAWSS